MLHVCSLLNVIFSYDRHAHKGTVMDVKWNRNGTWFLTASRDHLVKLFDLRNLKQEAQVSIVVVYSGVG